MPRAPAHLADLTPEQRRDAVRSAGHPAYRADQLSRHYFAGRGGDPGMWTDVPAEQRAQLRDELLPGLLTIAREVSCDGGRTRKTVWRLHDAALIESVWMRYPDRTTVCVSSQAGCGMGCPFCATGQAGLTRNLTAAEIVEQVVGSGRAGRVTNVVFMGMGEPLANYTAVTQAVRALTTPAPGGLGVSRRAVTVSTVGLVPAMHRLGDEGLGITLAVSLHAPDDELRNTLVPVNLRWPIAEVLHAADVYAARTGRRYSVEYALIRDINDSAEQAHALGALLRGRLAHVNLIPLNPTPGSPWTASRADDERVFVATARRYGVPVTVRDTRGRDIDGACGQLAALSTG